MADAQIIGNSANSALTITQNGSGLAISAPGLSVGTRGGIISTAASGATAVATLTGTPYAGPGLGGNLVQNGDFSNGSVGWSLNNATTGATIDTDPADAPPGSSSCLKYVCTNNGGGNPFQQIIPLFPNTPCTISGWVRGDGTNNAYLQMFGKSPTGTYSTYLASLGSPSASWTYISETITVPGNVSLVILIGQVGVNCTTYYGQLCVAQGTYTAAQMQALFSPNPLGNKSLVACEATTNLLSDGDCEGVGGTTTAVLFNDSFANANAWTTVSGTALTANQAAPTAAPASTVSGTTATVAAGTYITAYTWLTAAGQTTRSPETTVTVVAGNQINVPVPAFPTNVTAADIYITAAGGATGTETYQGQVTTSAGTFVLSAPPVTGAALPASNANANVAIVASGATVVAGHPDWWDTQASGGTSSSRMRFQTPSTLNSEFDIEISFVDANNRIYAGCNSGTFNLNKLVAGTFTNVGAAASVTFAVSTKYWFTWSRTGTAVTINLCADGSTPGAVLYTVSGTIADTAVQYGKLAIYNGCSAALLLGQMGATAYSGVCQVSGPVPSAWTPIVIAGTPALCWSKTQSFNGTYSLSISNNDTASGGQWYGLTGTITTATPALSARIKTSSLSGGAGVTIFPSSGIGVATLSAVADWTALVDLPTSVATGSTIGQNIRLTGTGLVYVDCAGVENLAYQTLNLDPFPAFYVPTGTRAAAYASFGVPTGISLASPGTLRIVFRDSLPAGVATNGMPFITDNSFNILNVYRAASGGGYNAEVGNTIQNIHPACDTVPHTAVLAWNGTGKCWMYFDGVLAGSYVYSYSSSGDISGKTLGLGYGGSSYIADASIAGLIITNHAWSAAEVASDYANLNPPGLISGSGLYLQPGMLYAQTPDATASSLSLPLPIVGKNYTDSVHAGVMRTGNLQPLPGQSIIGIQGAAFDTAGLLQTGGFKKLAGQTINTTQTTIAHGLGRIPNIIVPKLKGNAVVWESATADATNVYFTASVSATVDIFVA